MKNFDTFNAIVDEITAGRIATEKGSYRILRAASHAYFNLTKARAVEAIAAGLDITEKSANEYYTHVKSIVHGCKIVTGRKVSDMNGEHVMEYVADQIGDGKWVTNPKTLASRFGAVLPRNGSEPSTLKSEQAEAPTVAPATEVSFTTGGVSEADIDAFLAALSPEQRALTAAKLETMIDADTRKVATVNV